MSSFDVGVLVGVIIGVGLTYLAHFLLFVFDAWDRRRIERVELDQAWVRFTSSSRRIQ